MVSIPLVGLFGFLVFAAWKWAKVKIRHMLVGFLFGMALMTTPAGPAVYEGSSDLGATIFDAIAREVQD